MNKLTSLVVLGSFITACGANPDPEGGSANAPPDPAEEPSSDEPAVTGDRDVCGNADWQETADPFPIQTYWFGESAIDGSSESPTGMLDISSTAAVMVSNDAECTERRAAMTWRFEIFEYLRVETESDLHIPGGDQSTWTTVRLDPSAVALAPTPPSAEAFGGTPETDGVPQILLKIELKLHEGNFGSAEASWICQGCADLNEVGVGEVDLNAGVVD